MSFILVHQRWHGSQTFKNDRFVIHPNPNYSWILTDLSQSFVWRCSMAISVMVTRFGATEPHRADRWEKAGLLGWFETCGALARPGCCSECAEQDFRLRENFIVTAIKMTKDFGHPGARQHQSRNRAGFDLYPMPKWLNFPLGLKFNSEFLNDILWPFWKAQASFQNEYFMNSVTHYGISEIWSSTAFFPKW